MQQPPQQDQQSYYSPEEPSIPETDEPSKPDRTWNWIIAIWLFIALMVGMGIGYGLHTPATQSTTDASTAPTTEQVTTQPTDQPTQPIVATGKWVTTHTFSGNGAKKTAFFTVPANWKLVWKCTPSSDFSGEYNVMVSVYGSDGTPIDPVAINTICKSGNTGDSTDEHQGGQIYLDVNSEAAWTIQVQELK